MTIIKQEDLIQSIADSLQHISFYHPLDYIQALGRAYELEESPAAKDAIAQIRTTLIRQTSPLPVWSQKRLADPVAERLYYCLVTISAFFRRRQLAARGLAVSL